MDKNTQNPFSQKCKDCTPNIWDIIKQKANELNNKCYSNTYIWIEKFKDDN